MHPNERSENIKHCFTVSDSDEDGVTYRDWSTTGAGSGTRSVTDAETGAVRGA